MSELKHVLQTLNQLSDEDAKAALIKASTYVTPQLSDPMASPNPITAVQPGMPSITDISKR